jgi:hypothetical protein
MDVKILQHDVQTAKATIRFTHDGAVVENEYDLLLVLPDMKSTLNRTGSTFDAEMQNAVIATLTGWMQQAVDSGTFKAQRLQSLQGI